MNLDTNALEAGAKALFLRERKYHTPSIECPEPPTWEDLTETSMEHYRGNARAVLAVAQPVVSTVEELNALPVDTVILDGDPCVLQMVEKSAIVGSEWAIANEEHLYTTGKITLPARVLYRPVVES